MHGQKNIKLHSYQSCGVGGFKVSMTLSIASLRSIVFMEVNLHCVVICVLILYLTILSVAKIKTSHDNINNTFDRMR